MVTESISPVDSQRSVVAIRPAAKTQEGLLELLDLVYQGAAPLEALLARGP